MAAKKPAKKPATKPPKQVPRTPDDKPGPLRRTSKPLVRDPKRIRRKKKSR